MLETGFTYKKLKEALVNAKEKFNFIGFDEEVKEFGCVLLRHDIDMSMDKAETLAILENEIGIKATYYFLLRSDNYNILSENIISRINKIKELGHDIGLHFDHAFYGTIESEDELVSKLSFEKKIFETETNIKITSFAFHNTTPQILNFNKLSYAEMINVYNDKFFKKIRYCSDSYGIWRFKSMYEELSYPESIQILLHPAMWSEKDVKPQFRVNEAFNIRSEKSFENYIDFVKRNQPDLLK